jgi:hypothetical protein
MALPVSGSHDLRGARAIVIFYEADKNVCPTVVRYAA